MNCSIELPTSGSIISFSGILLAFEETVTQVAIERISYLPASLSLLSTTTTTTTHIGRYYLREHDSI